jgi:hypothetical protein
MINFPQVSQQVRELGEKAPLRAQLLQARRQQAGDLLEQYAGEITTLRQMAQRYKDELRCALPLTEPLTARITPLPLPSPLILLAADGSQINPDRNEAVQYCLINVGTILMTCGLPDAPIPMVSSELSYDDDVLGLTEDIVALRRDLAERRELVKLAEIALVNVGTNLKPPNVIALTDGPLELWGAKDSDRTDDFRKKFEEYLEALTRLQRLGIVNAGYVDKPSADLVVRLLEMAHATAERVENINDYHPLRGITDIDLYRDLLFPGERSAIFEIQSKSTEKYTGGLALRFFYLNVGRPGAPWLARVEIPAWVAETPEKLNALHAALIDQCQIMGSGSYPYLLHRAHETAVVTLEEKEQITQMIVHELRQRGVPVGEISHKQSAKSLSGRTRL